MSNVSLNDINNINFNDIDNNKDNIKKSYRKQVERELELKKKQLKDIPIEKKLRPNDLHRIAQKTDVSIFDEELCSIWTGYITNLNNKKKGTYINFYFKNKKKVALHRLLYTNFVGKLNDSDYIKYTCDNKGKCCNVNHMVKFEYSYTENMKKNKNRKKKKNINETLSDDFKVVIY
jgi:hypothetical protein